MRPPHSLGGDPVLPMSPPQSTISTVSFATDTSLEPPMPATHSYSFDTDTTSEFEAPFSNNINLSPLQEQSQRSSPQDTQQNLSQTASLSTPRSRSSSFDEARTTAQTTPSSVIDRNNQNTPISGPASPEKTPSESQPIEHPATLAPTASQTQNHGQQQFQQFGEPSMYFPQLNPAALELVQQTCFLPEGIAAGLYQNYEHHSTSPHLQVQMGMQAPVQQNHTYQMGPQMDARVGQNGIYQMVPQMNASVQQNHIHPMVPQMNARVQQNGGTSRTFVNLESQPAMPGSQPQSAPSAQHAPPDSAYGSHGNTPQNGRPGMASGLEPLGFSVTHGHTASRPYSGFLNGSNASRPYSGLSSGSGASHPYSSFSNSFSASRPSDFANVAPASHPYSNFPDGFTANSPYSNFPSSLTANSLTANSLYSDFSTSLTPSHPYSDFANGAPASHPYSNFPAGLTANRLYSTFPSGLTPSQASSDVVDGAPTGHPYSDPLHWTQSTTPSNYAATTTIAASAPRKRGRPRKQEANAEAAPAFDAPFPHAPVDPRIIALSFLWAMATTPSDYAAVKADAVPQKRGRPRKQADEGEEDSSASNAPSRPRKMTPAQISRQIDLNRMNRGGCDGDKGAGGNGSGDDNAGGGGAGCGDGGEVLA